MPSRFLNFLSPVAKIMPEVKPPDRAVGFNEKLFWTGIVLILYLVMSEIPLYGVTLSREALDQFTALRVLFASNRGTLMELGIQPIVTAGLILQLLAGSGLISVDFSKSEDRAIFTSITKFFSILMTIFLVIGYIIGGAYGRDLGTETAALIFLQLVAAGVILMLLDELLQKGWGLGSGISLFIMAGVAGKILWSAFCPLPVEEPGYYLGAVIAYVQYLLAGENPLMSFVYRKRPDLPTMMGLVATIAVFLIVIYFEGMKLELPVAYARYRGFRGRFPVKFLYVSNIPVILVSSLFMDVYFVAQIIWSRFNPDGLNMWLSLLGTFNPDNPSEPTGGIAKYIIAPRNFTTVLQDPIRAVVYTALMIVLCVMFSLVWIEVGGLGPRSVAEQLVDSGMQIPGFRRSHRTIERILGRYIPAVTVLGAIAVGAIAAVADFFGVYGTGMGVLLSVGILYQYYQIVAQERLTEMYPTLRAFIGRGR